MVTNVWQEILHKTVARTARNCEFKPRIYVCNTTEKVVLIVREGKKKTHTPESLTVFLEW